MRKDCHYNFGQYLFAPGRWLAGAFIFLALKILIK